MHHAHALEVGSDWWRTGPREALAATGLGDKVETDSSDEVKARYLYNSTLFPLDEIRGQFMPPKVVRSTFRGRGKKEEV